MNMTPFDIYVDTLVDMNIRTRGYATRNLVSSLNAQMVGFASRVIAQERRDAKVDMAGNATNEDESTIDSFNQLIAAQELREAARDEPMLAAPVGMAAPVDPIEAIKILAFFRDSLQDAMNLGDIIWRQEINTLASTLVYMATPRDTLEEDVVANAEMLGLPLKKVRERMKVLAHKRAKQMDDDRPRILEIILDATNGVGLYEWSEMPVAMQVRLAQKVDKILNDQANLSADQALMGGPRRHEHRTNYKIFEGGIKKMAEWLLEEEVNNPDFQVALMNAA
jgi:hypothetical protein